MRKAYTVFVFALLGACTEVSPPPSTVPPANVPTGAPPGEMIRIPAGEFLMGSDKQDTQDKAKEFGAVQPWYLDEHPRTKVHLPAYYLDKYEVNNAEFAAYFLATQQVTPTELSEGIAAEPANWSNLPAVHLTWYMARDYCRWAGKRLPTEAEWEKAARGPDGREYPWGVQWQPQRLNNGSDNWETGVAPVGSYSSGVSPYGIEDLAGNASEWVADWYQPYAGATFKSEFYGQTHRVVRGGGWGGVGHYVIPHFFRAAHRDYEQPQRGFDDIGFRCARDASETK